MSRLTVLEIRNELLKVSNNKDKNYFENYFRGVIKSLGVKTPKMMKVLKQLLPRVEELSLEEQKNLAFELIKSEYLDEKLFGVKLLRKNSQKFDKSIIYDLYELFKENVYDWATNDALCSFIGDMMDKNLEIADIMFRWKDSKNKWHKRASAVSFLRVAKKGKRGRMIIEICSTIVKDKFRFVQLGCGWLLRELSLSNLDLVVEFIKKNYDYFSREGLRYAIEKMNPELRKNLLNYKRNKKVYFKL